MSLKRSHLSHCRAGPPFSISLCVITHRVPTWRGITNCPLFIPSSTYTEQLASEGREKESCPTTKRKNKDTGTFSVCLNIKEFQFTFQIIPFRSMQFPWSTLDLLKTANHIINTCQQNHQTLQPVHASDNIYMPFAYYLFFILFFCLLKHTFYHLGHLSGCKCLHSWGKDRNATSS